MSETITELRMLTDEELVQRHDRLATHTVVGTSHYLEELRRRDAARNEHRMIALTEHVRLLTLVITGLTLANVVLVGWALLAL
ncbi:MAG TPA: hypothetical protein VM305_02140 [Candidatus Limnocylindrales bacterium]|nr:hypothetical protein [Candidatus Limnocylindrales bacterium]